MTTPWQLFVASHRALAGSSEEADRLIDTLASMEPSGSRIVWRCASLPREHWGDREQVASLIRTQILMDDFGRPIPGGGAHGTVRGYAGADPASPVAVAHWTVGAEDCPFYLRATFHLGRPSDHTALTCPRTADLAALMARTAASAGAHRSELLPASLGLTLSDHDIHSVGALTLAPAGVDLTDLPASLTTQPCPGLPGASIVVADLTLLDTDPQRLVTDLTTLAERLARPLAPSTKTSRS